MTTTASSACIEISPIERRKLPRTQKYFPQGLLIGCHPRSGHRRNYPANLVDVSEGGLGVEMLAPLVAGSAVSIAGELHSPGFCMAVQGRARVAHCECSEEKGVYRIGLCFEDVSFRSLFCTGETEVSEPACVRSHDAGGL